MPRGPIITGVSDVSAGRDTSGLMRGMRTMGVKKEGEEREISRHGRGGTKNLSRVGTRRMGADAASLDASRAPRAAYRTCDRFVMPSTKHIESRMLDLPDPFRPVMALNRGSNAGTTVRCA